MQVVDPKKAVLADDKEYIATVTSTGQVTIPVEIRELLGISAQNKILFRLGKNHKIELEPLPLTLENAFGSVSLQNESKQLDVVVERRGRRSVGLVDYKFLTELLELRRLHLKRQAFKELERLRNKVQKNMPPIDPVDAYVMAGFSRELAQKMVISDNLLSKDLA